MIQFSLPCIECENKLIIGIEEENLGRLKVICINCEEKNIYNLNILSGEKVERAKYNMVVLGKTGVGKSSLINYLCGKDLRNSGAGKPKTGKGFEEISIEINDLETKIFDSWGIEASKSEVWEEILDEEMKKRGIFSDIKDWFHTVFYCISVGGGRIEDFEIDLINQFIENKYKVNIIFTKADQANEEEIEELKKILNQNLKEKLPIIPVCNESAELLDGTKIEQFGKVELEKAIVEGFWDSIAMRIPDRCIKLLINRLNSWYSEQISYIEESFNFFKKNKIEEEINQEIEDFASKLDKEIVGKVIFKELKEVFDFYNQIAKSYFENNRTINQDFIPSHKQLFGLLKDSDEAEIKTFATVLEGTLTAGKGVLEDKDLGALLKIPGLLPDTISGFVGAIKQKTKSKENIKDNLTEAKEKVESGLKEMEPKLEQMFEKIRNHYEGEEFAKEI